MDAPYVDHHLVDFRRAVHGEHVRRHSVIHSDHGEFVAPQRIVGSHVDLVRVSYVLGAALFRGVRNTVRVEGTHLIGGLRLEIVVSSPAMRYLGLLVAFCSGVGEPAGVSGVASSFLPPPARLFARPGSVIVVVGGLVTPC